MATLKHGAFDHVSGDELHLVSLFFCAAGFQAGSLGRHLVCFFLLTHTRTLTERWKMLLSALVTPRCRSFFHGDGEAAPRGLMWEPSGDRAGLTDPRRTGQPDRASGRLNSCPNAHKCADKGHRSDCTSPPTSL